MQQGSDEIFSVTNLVSFWGQGANLGQVDKLIWNVHSCQKVTWSLIKWSGVTDVTQNVKSLVQSVHGGLRTVSTVTLPPPGTGDRSLTLQCNALHQDSHSVSQTQVIEILCKFNFLLIIIYKKFHIIIYFSSSIFANIDYNPCTWTYLCWWQSSCEMSSWTSW